MESYFHPFLYKKKTSIYCTLHPAPCFSLLRISWENFTLDPRKPPYSFLSLMAFQGMNPGAQFSTDRHLLVSSVLLFQTILQWMTLYYIVPRMCKYRCGINSLRGFPGSKGLYICVMVMGVAKLYCSWDAINWSFIKWVCEWGPTCPLKTLCYPPPQGLEPMPKQLLSMVSAWPKSLLPLHLIMKLPTFTLGICSSPNGKDSYAHNTTPATGMSPDSGWAKHKSPPNPHVEINAQMGMWSKPIGTPWGLSKWSWWKGDFFSPLWRKKR